MKKGIITFISFTVGAIGGIAFKTFYKKGKNKTDDKVYKFKLYYNVLNQWLMNKQEGKSVSEYFEVNGYDTIAIYGMGELGCRLYEELKNSNINIAYAIDKEAGSPYSNIEVYSLEDDLQPVDVIIVSAIFAFDQIKKELKKKVDCPIISLEDVIY